MTAPRRDEILDAATALFAQRGYRHTTLDAIAGSLGLGKTAIYHYFDGKQAIFAAAVGRVSESVLEMMRAAAAQESDPIDAVCAAIRARFHSLRTLYENLGIPDQIVSELGRIATETRGSFYDAEAEFLTDLLSAADRAGSCRIDSASETAAILSGMFRGVEGMLTEPERIGAGLETLEVALALVERGLRATSNTSTASSTSSPPATRGTMR